MRATVSVPPSVAYVDGEVMPDMPQGLTIEDAIYHTVHSHPGGVSALATRMGIPAGTLNHKANPNNATHHLHPRELVTMQHMSGNAAVLHSMAHSLGYTCTRAVPDQSGGDPVEAFMRMQMAMSDFVRSVADPLQLSSTEVNRNQMRRAEAMAADLQATIGDLLAAMRGAHAQGAGRAGVSRCEGWNRFEAFRRAGNPHGGSSMSCATSR